MVNPGTIWPRNSGAYAETKTPKESAKTAIRGRDECQIDEPTFPPLTKNGRTGNTLYGVGLRWIR